MKEYIGVDIGGTKIAVVKGDASGKVLKKVRFLNDMTPETAIGRIIDEARSMGSAEAIGISCGGPLDSKRGLILSPPNLPGWDSVPIVKLLEDALGIPAYLQNDADACALAEWKFGAGVGADNIIFLTFGTGMGAGLILNGRLYSGSCGSAGEIGHVRLERFGPVGYGKEGSFEGFASGGGIAQLGRVAALERLQMGLKTAYCESADSLDKISAQSIAQAAEAGDETAISVYRKCGEMLGRGLSILIDILNPEMIIIGSIYARSGKLLEESMREAIRAEALPHAAEACLILPAKLGESLGDVAALSVAVNGANIRTEEFV